MKTRPFCLLFVALAVVACAAEPAPAPEPEPAPMDDAAAVAAVASAYAEHYNMGHADVVAAMFADDGVTLFADGGVNMGRDAILASLTEAVGANPTATIETADVMVFGDQAVSRGSYSVSISPEGADPISFAGNWQGMFRKVEGEWKIGVLLSNYNAEPAAGVPVAPSPEDAPEDLTDSPTAALTASYAEHFNMGHPGVVAGLYSDDAVASFADQPIAEGRAAIEAALAERTAMGSPQLAIHEVGSWDLGDGWFAAGGWYQVEATTDAGAVTNTGSWISLVGTDAEGNQKIHWAITNVNHDAM